ncbi:MAG: membrane metalloprotease [Flavobacteriaceae bacterium]|nr:membrane metalloprotease [Flavobacteriaceae bacterium]
MRKISPKILFLLTIVFVLSACKSDDTEEMVEDPTAENKKALGTSAEDILSNDIYSSITVEIAFPPAFGPTETAKINLRNFLEERVNKPGGITFIETPIPLQSGSPFTISEIRDIEEDVRTQYTEGTNLAIFIYFSGGKSSNDTQTTVTLGTAYRNTSIVVFESTLKALTQSNPENLPVLESTTLNHEFGHILGLTNIQEDDIHTEHEDPDHLKHCFVEECLMYFDATNVTRSMVSRMFSKGTVPVLDPLCIEDLQAKGGL